MDKPSVLDRMKDLEGGGWWPPFGSIGRWTFHVTWSNWQFELGIEYAHDPGDPAYPVDAKWVSLHVGRLSLTWAKDDAP